MEHGHDYGKILFLYFYCLQCSRNAFQMVNQSVSGRVIARNYLQCKQAKARALFLLKLVQYTYKSCVQADISLFEFALA